MKNLPFFPPFSRLFYRVQFLSAWSTFSLSFCFAFCVVENSRRQRGGKNKILTFSPSFLSFFNFFFFSLILSFFPHSRKPSQVLEPKQRRHGRHCRQQLVRHRVDQDLLARKSCWPKPLVEASRGRRRGHRATAAKDRPDADAVKGCPALLL